MTKKRVAQSTTGGVAGGVVPPKAASSNPGAAVAMLIARGIEPSLNTEEAAAALNRKPQTLRKSACLEC